MSSQAQAQSNQSVKIEPKSLSREARTLLEALEAIDRYGWFGTIVPLEWIEWEVVPFANDRDFMNFLREVVPKAIKEVAKEIGAEAYVYHKEGDVEWTEYIVKIYWNGKKYMLFVDYAPIDVVVGKFTLCIDGGEEGWYEPSERYHLVP